MTLMQLRCFYEAAKIQNFTAAANNLYIAQSSLSYAISKLESELDTPLFIRRANKKIELTMYGELLLPFVESGLKSLDDGENLVRNFLNPLSGQIKIGFFFCVSFTMIPTIFRRFNEDYPESKIQIDFDVNHYWTDLESRLLQGVYDLVISAGSTMQDCECIPVASQKLSLILPNNHPLAGEAKIPLEAVANEKFLCIDPQSYLDKHIKKMMLHSNITPEISYCSDWISQFSSISMGYGIAISTELPANKDLISVVEIDHPMILRDLYLAYPKNRKLAPNVKFVRDYIINLSKNLPPEELAF